MSLGRKSTSVGDTIRSATMFLCESIIPFAIPVVPDVNMIILISLLSICASRNDLSPSAISRRPSSSSSHCDRIPSAPLRLSWDISSSRPVPPSCIILTKVSSRFSSKITAEHSASIIRFLSSSYGSSLSSGTTMPVPHTVPRYPMPHMYVVSPITAIRRSFMPLAISAVPMAFTSSKTSRCVIVLYGPVSNLV